MATSVSAVAATTCSSSMNVEGLSASENGMRCSESGLIVIGKAVCGLLGNYVCLFSTLKI